MPDINRLRALLVINPFGIGDVISSTPLLRNLKKANPSLRIDYLCNKRVAPLLKTHPLLSRVIVYERDDFENLRRESLWQWGHAMIAFIALLRRERFDAVLDLSLNTKFSFFPCVPVFPAASALILKREGGFSHIKCNWPGFLTRMLSSII